MQNVLLWNLILKSNRIIEIQCKIWENFLNMIIQLGHFPKIGSYKRLHFKVAYRHTRVLEKLIWVLEKPRKFVSVKGYEPWIVIDPKSELLCDCHWHDFSFLLLKETSKEQYYPNVFVLLSVSIFREIVLNDQWLLVETQ